MIIKNIFFICIYALSFQMVQSQTTYMTKKGHLKMIAKIDGKTVVAESHKLYVNLDYINKKINGTLDLKSLITDIPELKKYLKEAEQPLLISFSGTIPPDDFMAQPHQPLIFNWQININFQDKNFKVILKTTLQHIKEGSTFSCRLNAMGKIFANEMNLNKIIPNIDNIIEIQFVQFILKV